MGLFWNGSEGKESACNAGDLGSVSGSGRSPGEGNDYPLQYSCLENPRDRGAWQAPVHGICRVTHRATNTHFHFFTYMGPPGKISMQLEIFKVTPGTSLVGPAMECLPANAGDKGSIPGPGGFHQPQDS